MVDAHLDQPPHKTSAGAISTIPPPLTINTAITQHDQQQQRKARMSPPPRASRSMDVESQSSRSPLLASPPFERYVEDKSSRRGGSKQAAPRIDARVISDAIIGLSDGLTVPFALTAGLSALGNTRVVIFAGLAELTAGAISMGLGGYLGAKSEEDSQRATLVETQSLCAEDPHAASLALETVFAPYDLPAPLLSSLTAHLTQDPAQLSAFLLHFQHNLPPEAVPAAVCDSDDRHSQHSGRSEASTIRSEVRSRAVTCALTIAGGYFAGGFVPLVPYFFVGDGPGAVTVALIWSVVVMALSLFAFGYVKTCFVSGWRGRAAIWEGVRGGGQMVVVGGVAAGCAMGLVRLFDWAAAAAQGAI